MMKTLTLNRWGKLGIAAAVSLTVLLSGGPVAPANTAMAASSTSSKASSIIATAKKYMGTPYKFGSSLSTTRTFDCSSFVSIVYRKYGVSLPRTSQQMSHAGSYVSKSQLKPGDLVFFYSPVHHVAIYIGNGKILHTYGKPGVTISNLNSSYWKSHYKTARRVL